MVIKRFFLTMVCAMCVALNVWATPPMDVSINYDKEKKILHVSSAHPSDHLDKHYLRRIVIFKNDVEDKSVAYPRQKMPSGIEEDIAYDAKGDDVISVKIFCSQGGIGIAQTTVAPDQKEKKK